MLVSPTVLFSETQPVPRGLRMASVAIAGFVIAFSVAMFFVMQSVQPTLSNMEAVWFFVAVVALPVALLLWFNSVRQTVEITEEKIIINQHGVHIRPKVINRADVKQMTVRKFNAFCEFGGCGILCGSNRKWGYVCARDHAIDILMNDGRRYVISVVDYEHVNMLVVVW